MEEAEVRQKGKLRHSHAGEYRFSSQHNGRPLEGFKQGDADQAGLLVDSAEAQAAATGRSREMSEKLVLII